MIIYDGERYRMRCEAEEVISLNAELSWMPYADN